MRGSRINTGDAYLPHSYENRTLTCSPTSFTLSHFVIRSLGAKGYNQPHPIRLKLMVPSSATAGGAPASMKRVAATTIITARPARAVPSGLAPPKNQYLLGYPPAAA